jgi:hypothetical protein
MSLEGLKYPKFELPYIQYTVELPFNVPQFEGLPHLRLEKVNNFSIFLSLVFISIIPQRNILNWGLAVTERKLKHFA